MMYAAKVMSQATIALYANPDKLQAVRAEFEQAKVAVPYVCPIPDDKQPPYNKHPYR
jgi:aminobenzoyl-glutamate utilization protein B